jgi:SHS2 domain-containing protein
MNYKFLEHTADVKFLSQGKTIEECFKAAALALKETILKGKIEIKRKQEKEFRVKGKDYESLLYNFLEEFLYLLDAEDFLLSEIKKIEIKKSKEKGYILKAKILGDKASRYRFTNDVKAITYNDIFVKKQGKDKEEKFICQVVLDV